MIEALAEACWTLQVEAGHRGPSSVFRVDLPSGSARVLNTLDVRVNAIGYSAAQDRVYGVDDDGRVVVLDRSGHRVPVDSPRAHLLRHAVAGAVVGERLVVRVGHLLLSVDVDPGSDRYLDVVHKAWLWPPPHTLNVDDFDLNPADGLLYGVATFPHAEAYPVTIDPRTGHVQRVPGAGRLPAGHGYGAVVVGRDGAMYATGNRDGGRSTLYRVALDGSGAVNEIVSRPAVRTLDAAGCLAVPPIVVPPQPSPTTPAPTTSPTTTVPATTTAATTTPATTAMPAPIPPGARPTTVTTSPTTTTTPATTTGPSATSAAAVPPTPPTRRPMRLPERQTEVVSAGNQDVRDQRRWGLVALVFILAAGALARQHARGR